MLLRIHTACVDLEIFEREGCSLSSLLLSTIQSGKGGCSPKNGQNDVFLVNFFDERVGMQPLQPSPKSANVLIGVLSKVSASLMRNNIPKRPSGAPLHTLSKLYNGSVGFIYTLIWDRVLLHLRSPNGGCYSTSDDLSCSCFQACSETKHIFEQPIIRWRHLVYRWTEGGFQFLVLL